MSVWRDEFSHRDASERFTYKPLVRFIKEVLGGV